LTYSAFEVFEIAEQVERNGAKLYRAEAELTSDPQARRIFLRLAEWEIRHEKVFARMKRENAGLTREPGTAKSGKLPPDPSRTRLTRLSRKKCGTLSFSSGYSIRQISRVRSA